MIRRFFLSTITVNELEDAFISRWNTNNTSTGSSTATQVAIPTLSSGVYNCTVDWGDGNSDVITTWDDPAWTHTYSSGGEYTIKITGQFEGMQFNNGKDRLKILNISTFGTNVALPDPVVFRGCANLTSVSGAPDTSGATNLGETFRDCTALTSVDLTGWVTSSATNMGGFLRNCTSVGTVDVSNFDVSGATNIALFFENCGSMGDAIGVEDWVISSVTSASGFLSGASIPTQRLTDLYVNWEAQRPNINSNVSFHGGTGNYFTAQAGAARQRLIDDFNWTITDGGGI